MLIKYRKIAYLLAGLLLLPPTAIGCGQQHVSAAKPEQLISDAPQSKTHTTPESEPTMTSAAKQRPGGQVAGQLMLMFRNGTPVTLAEKLIAQHDAVIITRYTNPLLFHIGLPGDVSVQQGLKNFTAFDEIEFAEPNQIYRAED